MTDFKERRRFEAEFARVDASTDPFVSAVRATRMPMLITDPHQPDNPIVFVNAAFSKLTGYEHDEIIGRNCRFLQGPETDRGDVARMREAIERREAIEIEVLNYTKNGGTFWNRVLISPVFDKDGDLTYFFASQFDVTVEREKLARIKADRDALEQEVVRRTRDLSLSEERLRFILTAARMGSWTIDLAAMRLTASDTFKATLGRQPREPLTFEDLIDATLPQDRERMQAALLSAVGSGADYDIEYRVRLPGGEVRWLLIRGQCFCGEDSKPQTMAGIALDVTDRKLAEEHKALLAEELKHRVKNSMATMQSIAHQTLRNAASLQDAHATLDARLQSLSTAHDVLTRESWTGAPLAEIADEALRPFLSGAAQRFTIHGPDVWLPPRLTLAFTLALHELATNASKYGALSNDWGRVLLQWDVVEAEGSSDLTLRWEEIDGPPVVAPARAGFGSRLIERALAAEMDGTAKIAFEPKGLVFSLRAPAPATLAATAEEDRPIL